MGWFQHVVKWTGSNSGTMPTPISVEPKYEFKQAIFKTAAGTMKVSRKGIWAGVKAKWWIEPDELATLELMLAAENADTDAVPFTISFNNGTTYRRARLTKDFDPKPLQGINAAVEVELEFEFTARMSSLPSPLHLGTA
jgi:hypothetical protein